MREMVLTASGETGPVSGAVDLLAQPADKTAMTMQTAAGILLTAIKEIVTEDYGAANVLYEAQDQVRPVFEKAE